MRSCRSILVAAGVCWAFAGPAAAVPDQIMQEGLVTDAQGRAFQGRHRIVVRLYTQAAGGQPFYEEIHPQVLVNEGYYALAVGSVVALNGLDFLRPDVFIGLTIDNGQEAAPRTPFVKVPAAFVADVARNVTGDITPRSISISGTVVIDANGRWVGDPSGLRGPAGAPGPAGAAGQRGPQGLAGAVGGDGSPDTPDQVLAKVVQVDGAASGLDADLLDGLSSAAFMRADQDTGTTGSVDVGGNRLNMNGRAPRISWAGATGGVNNAIDLDNRNIVGANRLNFFDPGPTEGLSWSGSQAKIVVSPLNGRNADGFLRLINDEGISLESDVLVTGDLTMAAGAGITLADRPLVGVGNPGIQFADPGPDGAITWAGTGASILVSPLDNGNADGYLRLKNDGGISLESDVRASGDLFITGQLGVGTTTPSGKVEIRDDSAQQTGLVIRNERAGTRTRPSLTLKGITPNNQGAQAVIRLVTGVDAGGADNRNDGGLEVIVTSGGAGASRSVLMCQHDGDVGIGTSDPKGRLHVNGADSRRNPLVVSSVSPGIYFHDTETQNGALRYDSFAMEVDGSRFHIGARAKADAATAGSGQRQLTLQSNGNLGIGDTSPRERLTVRGNGYIDGDLTVTGRINSPTTNIEAYAGTVSASTTQAREREIANFTINDRHWSSSNGFFVEAYSRYYDSGYVRYYIEAGYTSKEVRKIESRGDLATRFGLRLVEDGIVGQRGGFPERRFRLYAQAGYYSQWRVFIKTGSMTITSGDVDQDGRLGVKGSTAHRNVAALTNNVRHNAMEGSLAVTGSVTVGGPVKHSRSAMNAARAICYSALTGNSNRGMILVPLPNQNANLDAVCHASVNGGWNAGGVAKGNYSSQDCPTDLENDSYGGGYTSYVTEGYFESNRRNYGSCGPTNAFICCSPQFPN